MSQQQQSVDGLPREVLVELAYVARQSRWAHPRGRSDPHRWYPDEEREGSTPNVRSPSRAWPWSYMTACRTRRHCAQLPEPTLLADAATGLACVLDGTITLSIRSARIVQGALTTEEPRACAIANH